MFIVIAKLSEGRRKTREEKKTTVRLSGDGTKFVENRLYCVRVVYREKKPGEVGLRLVLRLESLKELGLISCGGGGNWKIS